MDTQFVIIIVLLIFIMGSMLAKAIGGVVFLVFFRRYKYRFTVIKLAGDGKTGYNVQSLRQRWTALVNKGKRMKFYGSKTTFSPFAQNQFYAKNHAVAIEFEDGHVIPAGTFISTQDASGNTRYEVLKTVGVEIFKDSEGKEISKTEVRAALQAIPGSLRREHEFQMREEARIYQDTDETKRRVLLFAVVVIIIGAVIGFGFAFLGYKFMSAGQSSGTASLDKASEALLACAHSVAPASAAKAGLPGIPLG